MTDDPDRVLQRSGLLRLFSGSFLIRITYYVFGFVNSVLLARFLGAESYGVYVYVLSIVALLSVPTQFGMPMLVMREFSALQAKAQWAYMKGLALRSHQFVAVVATVVCLSAALWLWLNPAGYAPEKRQALLLGLLLVPLLSLGALRDAMLGGLRHIILAQLPESVIRPLLLMLGLLVAMFLLPVNASADNVIVYYAGCSLVAFLSGWALFRRRTPDGLASAAAAFATQKWFAAALPIGLTAGMQVLNMQLSIVLLEFYSSDAEIAFYRVATLGASFVVIILQVSNTVVSPYISRLHAQQDMRGIETLVGRSNKLVILATIPLVLGIVIAGPWLLATFYGAEFGAAYLPLLLLTAGQAVNALLGTVGALLNMTGHQRDITQATSVALALNIALHLLLLPRFGLEGAAFSSMTMLVTWNLILWFRVKQRLRIRYYL
ncbi:MAG: polysaccharide biosynthesis C-terminal domain-containing protein [Halioglobus sp.]|nr:polysaccharide biosynthesis C-terminal domain-containing protein [Halioglobus sp.]